MHLFKKLQHMSQRLIRVKSAAVIVVLLVTAVVVVRFFVLHPEYLKTLTHVHLSTILAIAGLNVVLLVVLASIYELTLHLCGAQIAFKEQLLLTSYSSIANFFGPLQSGPAVRTVYLKTRHKVRMRSYVLATLISYGIYAAINVLFLFAGSRPWWQAALAVIAAGVVSLCVIKLASKRASKTESSLRLELRAPILSGLVLAVLVQALVVAGYYFIELRAVGVHASLGQTITYTGAANLALFVSVTPDAIGFREAFLRLSQQLHHISSAAIISANVLDRAVYAAFLGILFLLLLALHGREKIRGAQQAHPTQWPTDQL